MTRDLRRLPLVPWLTGILVGACGPSVQTIYEGNVRFEHCYRLDLDLEIAPTHREACWRQWLTSHTHGQPRDRIEYARRRLRAFTSGDASRPLLNMSSGERSADREFYLVVPSPTSAHAPPPQLAPKRPVPEPVPSASASERPPGDDCAGSCRSSFRSCQAACAPGGGASEAACRSCEPDYKACMRRCFE